MCRAWEPAAAPLGQVPHGVTLNTTAGAIRLQLFPQHAPTTVRNFVDLASGDREYTDPRTGLPGNGPFYDGTIFHRVISGFMIQGGSRTGDWSGPGYQLDDEIHADLRFDRPYLLAMANVGPNTNGSQFLITVAAAPHLDGRHTIFGEVVDEASRRVVDAIANVGTTTADRPVTDVVVERVVIESLGSE